MTRIPLPKVRRKARKRGGGEGGRRGEVFNSQSASSKLHSTEKILYMNLVLEPKRIAISS